MITTRSKPPRKPKRVFVSEEERSAAYYTRKKEWRTANPERVAAAIKKFRNSNPLASREWHLQKKYGLSVQGFVDVFLLQGKACAACFGIDSGRKNARGVETGWVVDHCHTTGKIRGIICHPCNVAAGVVGDSPNRLRAIASYLEKA